MKVSVEPAKVSDLDELFRIELECFAGEAFTRGQLAILLNDTNAVGLLARVNGEVAGFIIGVVENCETFSVGHIYTIDVAVGHRRKGVGQKLLEEIEKVFLREGAETSYLEVRSDNQAARRLYQKQEYQETEPLDDYYSRGISGLRLKKQLRPTRNFSGV